MDCIFCSIASPIYEDACVIAFFDAYSVTTGHTLIVPRRHVPDYFSLTNEEKRAIDRAILALKRRFDQSLKPAGYNIGINNGKAAGQTVFHCHVHLIPRYVGDVSDPRGGVRGVIPSKQKY